MAWIDVLPPRAATAKPAAGGDKPKPDLFVVPDPAKPAAPAAPQNAAPQSPPPATEAAGGAAGEKKAAQKAKVAKPSDTPKTAYKPAIGLFGDRGPAKPAKAPAKPAIGLFGDRGPAKPPAAAAAEADAAQAKAKSAGVANDFGGKIEAKGTIVPATRVASGVPAAAGTAAAAGTGGTAPTAVADDSSKTAGPAVTLSGGVEVKFSDPLPAGSDQLTAATAAVLTDRLLKTGLTDEEVKRFVSNYAPLLFDAEAVIVACRLDPRRSIVACRCRSFPSRRRSCACRWL